MTKPEVEAVATRRELAVAIGGEAADTGELGRPGQDNVEHERRQDGAHELGDHIRQEAPNRKPASHGKAQRDGRVEVATGNMSDGIGHGQDGEAESQRDTEKADPDLRKGSGEDGRAATTEHQPERAETLGRQRPLHIKKLLEDKCALPTSSRDLK